MGGVCYYYGRCLLLLWVVPVITIIGTFYCILQSGSLYADWGWYTSERKWKEVVEGIKRKTNCPSSESVYDCLSGLSVKEVYAVLPANNAYSNLWHPMPDDDFFSLEVMNDGYNLSRR